MASSKWLEGGSSQINFHHTQGMVGWPQAPDSTPRNSKYTFAHSSAGILQQHMAGCFRVSKAVTIQVRLEHQVRMEEGIQVKEQEKETGQ